MRVLQASPLLTDSCPSPLPVARLVRCAADLAAGWAASIFETSSTTCSSSVRTSWRDWKTGVLVVPEPPREQGGIRFLDLGGRQRCAIPPYGSH